MNVHERSPVGKILYLLQRIGIHPRYLAFPIALSLLSAAFEGVSMGLLIPILQGFFQKSFAFVMDVPYLAAAFEYLPAFVREDDRMLFGVFLGCFVLLYILKNIVRFCSSVAVAYFAERSIHHLRKALFARYLSFGKFFFDTTTVGHHSTLLMEFTRQAFNPLLSLERYINAIASLLVYFIIMLSISWRLTLIALPLFVILNFAVRHMVLSIKSLSRTIAERGAELGKQSVEILSTIPLVKSYRTERNEQDHYTFISNEKARLDFRVRALQALILPMQEVITMLFTTSIFVGTIWFFGRDQIASASALVVYFYAVMNASSKFGGISGFRGTLASANGPLDEVLTIFEDDEKAFVQSGNTAFTGLQRSITFKDVTFAYSDRSVLDGVSLSIPKGKMTAIVGPTGSGKSTIISLLMRFYDCPEKSIFIDETDIRDFTLDSYLQHVALVSQETLLFHASLRDNITYGLSDVSDAAVRDAVQRSRLEEFVQELPGGLDTLVGDRGVQLSGGEKQRVSIARALLKGAEILILDEATSALDSKTENLIQEAIDDAVVGRTSIVIAHRLSTIQHADSIVVMESGRVAESGTLQELLDNRGAFHELWEQQKFS